MKATLTPESPVLSIGLVNYTMSRDEIFISNSVQYPYIQYLIDNKKYQSDENNAQTTHTATIMTVKISFL